MTILERLQRTEAAVRQRVDFVPRVALVLGSGLGDFADHMDVAHILPYQEIEGFPTSTAPYHKGRFVFGHVGGVPVVAMQGRVHYYEGYPMEDVVLPTRLMARLGAGILFLTNASGGVNLGFKAGDLMLIEDQISCFVPSPLIGPNQAELGLRFADMTCVYDAELRGLIQQAARQQNVPLQRGVYMQLSGPQFETPAEVRLCRSLGADAVGMSTACEAIAARHMGVRVCGVSCIANMAAGITGRQLTEEEVAETGEKVAADFQKLVSRSIEAMRPLL